jgi:putative membrane protein
MTSWGRRGAACAVTSLLLTAGGAAFAQDPGERTPARVPEDAAAMDFVIQAAHAGQVELALGKLAFDKAASPTVKVFAQRMVQDNARANQELSAIAREHGWDMPAGPPKRHQAEEERLGRMAGAAFDTAYVRQMVKQHERVVRLFEQAERQVRAPALRAWAGRQLPVLREHLDRARTILTTLEAAGAGRDGRAADAGSTGARRIGWTRR